MRKLKQYADDLGCSLSQLALAWSVRNCNVTTTLMGATTTAQIEDNLGAVAVARGMTRTDDEKIEEILGNRPGMYFGWGGAGKRAIDRIENLADDSCRIANPMLPLGKFAGL